MKKKNGTNRLISIILTLILLLTMGTGGFTIYADSEHTHGTECYCPGGEYICGLTESEEHTHGGSCICSGGELICTASAVAKIGSTMYDSLSDAVQAIIDSAEKSGTIVIINDQTVSSSITVPKDVSIKITDNGTSHEITKSPGKLFIIQDGGSLTIDGNLTFKPADTSNACMIECHGTLNLNNGTFDGNNISVNPAGATHNYVGMIYVCGNNATFTMNGGKLLNAKLINLQVP